MSYMKWSTNWGICVTVETENSPAGSAGKDDRQAREERISRLIEEGRGLLRQNQVIFDRWRAEGILPPKEPGQRV